MMQKRQAHFGFRNALSWIAKQLLLSTRGRIVSEEILGRIKFDTGPDQQPVRRREAWAGKA